ncbi:MAG: ABC transporter ATP-binding protein [Actinobacteria bacterium]|nr:ABC transporter ATP-binding protein [Actinomycetota bacterium]
MTAVLELAGVCRHYRDGDRLVAALDGVDLEIHPGELVAITGRSGVGKSTLVNLAGGLDRPTAGKVLIEGTDLTTLGANDLAAVRRRHLGFVFQSGNLIPTLTAVENVALPLELDGVSVRDAHDEARAAIASVADPALADRYPDQLSGGEQQRVAVARALTGRRRLLLADEPTGALDEVSAEGVLRLIRQRCDAGASALMVTHDPAQAAWADRIVRLRDGIIESVVETSRDVEVVR